MTVFLVAGKTSPDFLKTVLAKANLKKDHFIGIDRGTLLLLNAGQQPDFGVGDFDSLQPFEKEILIKENVSLKALPTEKDDTDTQQGLLKAIHAFPDDFYVLVGGTGGRIDHFLANLYLPLEDRFAPYRQRIVIADEQNIVTFYGPGEHLVKRNPEMKYLGYVPLTAVKHLFLKDSKYTLENVTTTGPVAYPSNEFVGETASFSFEEGVVAVIQSKD